VPALVPNLDPGHAAARVVTTAVVAAVDPASDMSPRSAGEAAARELVSQDAPTFGADSRREGAAVVAPAATPMTAAPLPVMPRPMHSAMPFQGELSVALRSPEFAPALGTQLGIWVRDGIECAQLKLNPAEMGPIDVRISLDGDRARVDFSAAHAGTRQVLQDAVPVLASTLRESGLTLTGGGVFDQSHDPRGDAQPDTPQGGPRVFDAMEGGASSHTAAARLPRARGVVDLYA
jgi:flagellar hook-length control protein FliK